MKTLTEEETTLSELAERVKARAVPPVTFRRIGGGIDADAWLKRLDKAAERLEADIHDRRPREFAELLVVLEKSYCPKCDGRAAECPISDWIAKNKNWHDSDFCPRCFGRFVGTFPVIKDNKQVGDRRVYADSEPFILLGRHGDRFIMARCDCRPAIDLYGQKCPESPTLRNGLCAVRRWHVERTVMTQTYARWKREAVTL